uniref:histidine kinase dimerization/phospho-acceptor domain-containing protein n=1 Tax=Pedobacter sp. TaxID=1411316 RepID=UPI003D7FB599
CKSASAKAFINPEEIIPAVVRKFDGKGGYVITQWEYKALFDEQQQPAGVFCIGHDITQYMLTSTELENTKESLSKTQLTLSQMAYVQSHVIRKPIANIMGLTLLLESFEMDPNIEQMINMIKESAKELDQVIKDIATNAIN